MKLVLAEKPSVAQSIAKVLGAAKREDGYLEGNGYVVSWCVGHLVELAQPEVYDAKYSKWAYADLPIFPMDWQYEVSAGTKKQFGILKKLMAREDVASLMASTYGLPEMARMLGVHRQTIYYIVANEDFELIKVGRYKRATKESFEKWYHNQTRYQLAEDRQERS